MKYKTISWLFLLWFGWVSQQSRGESFAAFENIPLNRISPEGWQRSFLQKQRDGLTGHLDETCEPFSRGGWAASTADWKPPFYKRQNGAGHDVLCWEPFEQTGYYYDGAIRCGLLLNDPFLIDKAETQIYGSIKNAEARGGVIHADIPDRWPHVTFFRAFMADYEATQDPRILDALRRHYANDTFSLAGARSIFNVEQLLWLYQQTGKSEYRDRAKALYDAQSFRKRARMVNRFEDLASDERQDVHGVTFHEALKLPIMLYMATGEQKYLDAARNGYRKLDQFHMLADGVPSSEEGLSGKTSLSCHETCDITDYIWATSYMLKATGETEWADKIERAALNAGMIAATKDFDAHVYLSSLNQVVCNIGSCSSPISNPVWNAYAQRQMPWCCTGNITRFFPIYAGLQWLKGKDGALVKALYGPGSCVHDVNGTQVTLREESGFPFSDTIKLIVTKGEASFPLRLRIPSWAVNPSVQVNGKQQDGVTAGRFFTVNGTHRAGDVVTLQFPMEARVKPWEMNGVVVDYGPGWNPQAQRK
ncbi:MAG: glycoside hydrolase family 127 protein [Verrucomicrobiota bacterium]|nr:glycoside hydrolase family 127 protein [Verrucomicrobiota bacterium]